MNPKVLLSTAGLLQHRVALKMYALLLGSISRQSYVHGSESGRELLKAVSSDIEASRQVETRLYSQQLFNRFPSVRMPFSGKLTSDLGENLELICAFRQCALWYEQSRLIGDNGARAGSVKRRNKAVWDEVRSCSQAISLGPSVLDVVVPVHNNGIFLLAKCLPSLVANNAWKRMRVLIVDDASDDDRTKEILTELESGIKNVEVIRLKGTPSGSASVPRNKGLCKATSGLVSFLDPDNEISVGGYDELLRQFYSGSKRPEAATGYQLKVGKRLSVNSRHTFRRRKILSNPKSLLQQAHRFPVISTQASVIDLQFLQNCGLRFIEGAVGQDTVFGWEILLKANRIVLCSRPYIVYYAERNDSVTNEIGSEYFSKALIRERAQSKLLRKYGLIQRFRKYQLEPTMSEVYKPKLDSLQGDNLIYAEKVLEEIYRLYDA
ncbi:glycosyltransferase [Corynebacterium tuberculostearicum]|uniref:glycosyltransferase n=1 Tax=Corynebacterium tuberculostearicum TaxID=38304 RepID=UPI0038D21801